MFTTRLFKNGFTLIEITVAVGILTLLLLLIAGAYGRFVGLQREGIGQQEMQEDARLFLQLFNREARTAYGNTYQPIVNPPGIVFRNQEGNCVRYALSEGSAEDTNTITRAEATPSDIRASCVDPNLYSGQERQLTDSQNTVVEALYFDALPAQFTPSSTSSNPKIYQGYITVYLTVRSAADPSQAMQLQSTVTSRQLIPY